MNVLVKKKIVVFNLYSSDILRWYIKVFIDKMCVKHKKFCSSFVLVFFGGGGGDKGGKELLYLSNMCTHYPSLNWTISSVATIQNFNGLFIYM